MTPRPITERAHAKINLCLHVTGQRNDGYHLLDSIVAFATPHDRLRAVPAGMSSLTLEGPFGGQIPADMDNLVMRAARALVSGSPMAFTLEKHLPPASGIGGGSADAAAAIRAALRWGDEGLDIETILSRVDRAALLALGADVPVCLASQPARMRGVGETLEFLAAFPACPLLLVNPRVEVPTPAVFRALAHKNNPPLPQALPEWPDVATLASWLHNQRNDLQAPALSIAPVIGRVLDRLTTLPGALLARMSGSGATCFALFDSAEAAVDATRRFWTDHPQWWVAGGELMPANAGFAQFSRLTT